MIATSENQDIYLSRFAQLGRRLAGSGQEWLDHIRKGAIERFAELGFPTTRNEDWKYTNVAPIARIPFRTPEQAANGSVLEALRRSPLADLECSRLVFVDGRYSRELSKISSLPPGVRIGHLAAVLATPNNGFASLEQNLARYASFENHPFVALNTAFMEDGALIEVPKDIVLGQPIFLLFVSTTKGQPTVTHPRNLILVGRGSQASFIEGYVGLDIAAHSTRPASQQGAYFTNTVTEIVAGEGAVIDYCKVQQESESSFHIATVQVHQERSSSVTTNSIAFGGRLVREEINAVLDGEGAECLLDGLYVVGGTQHVDNHTAIDHAKPHCGSRELYKGVLDGKSTGVFNGKIIVRKDAQKTDSKQSNKNLLLSEDAVINTKPQLEIWADDVKCTHGATIGQVDQEAIFYLRSRGIALEEARNLLLQAFASDIITRIKFEPLRERLNQALRARLAKGLDSGSTSQRSEGEPQRASALQQL
jgi:Fe-S cluster assembly protein SufD